jgi:hypothetical protein
VMTILRKPLVSRLFWQGRTWEQSERDLTAILRLRMLGRVMESIARLGKTDIKGANMPAYTSKDIVLVGEPLAGGPAEGLLLELRADYSTSRMAARPPAGSRSCIAGHLEISFANRMPNGALHGAVRTMATASATLAIAVSNHMRSPEKDAMRDVRDAAIHLSCIAGRPISVRSGGILQEAWMMETGGPELEAEAQAVLRNLDPVLFVDLDTTEDGRTMRTSMECGPRETTGDASLNPMETLRAVERVRRRMEEEGRAA